MSPRGWTTSANSRSYGRESGRPDSAPCGPLPNHPAEGTQQFTYSSPGLWPGGFRGESLAEKGLPLLPWRGGADSVSASAVQPQRVGVYPLVYGPQQAELRNFLVPGLGGGARGHHPESQDPETGVQRTQCSPLHNPEAIGFASYVGIRHRQPEIPGD